MRVPRRLNAIQNIVVLMMENRSLDHLLGSLRATNPQVAGLTGHESNFPAPPGPLPPSIRVRPATSFAMPFDPGHEFEDVQVQLYGPQKTPVDAAPMSGFVCDAVTPAVPGVPAQTASDAARVMEYFTPAQAPVMAALAQEFALFNGWFSSLPGPTWPNRFFVHAATSGGLTESPSTADVIRGFSFDGGTIYDALDEKDIGWRIYHDGLPQTAGIQSLRLEFINPLTENFREMEHFAADVNSNSLPPYTFIEPNYDTGHNYQRGNSMHPLNDIRKGEALVKQVYETLRASAYWSKMMLIVTFDEHGGFYDHVSPPAAVATGDDYRYATAGRNFAFNRLGVRVPGIVVSAYTRRNTVFGTGALGDPAFFDHSSVIATAALRFGLPPLTARDAAANTLDVALNLRSPRLNPAEAPLTLPASAPDMPVALRLAPSAAARPTAHLSDNQRSFLALAAACDLSMSAAPAHPKILTAHREIQTQQEAAPYVRAVEAKIRARRLQAAGTAPKNPRH
jgi:phospholipase C